MLKTKFTPIDDQYHRCIQFHFMLLAYHRKPLTGVMLNALRLPSVSCMEGIMQMPSEEFKAQTSYCFFKNIKACDEEINQSVKATNRARPLRTCTIYLRVYWMPSKKKLSITKTEQQFIDQRYDMIHNVTCHDMTYFYKLSFTITVSSGKWVDIYCGSIRILRNANGL